MDTIISVSTAAKKINVSRSTILTLIKNKSLPAIRIGKVWRIKESDLKKFIEKNYHGVLIK